jgi:hypothetical protein
MRVWHVEWRGVGKWKDGEVDVRDSSKRQHNIFITGKKRVLEG